MKNPMLSKRILLRYLSLWFLFSASTLFLNKYIISYQNGDAMLLGIVQMLCCSMASYVHLQISQRFLREKHENKSKFAFQLHHLMVHPFKFALIGAFRFSTVVLGLVALWYIPVSFAEMIKSCAPIFTVIISLLILKEKSSLMNVCSLLPIMIGLALCSAYEIHFNLVGFLVAILGNLSECTQNVLTKKVLIFDRYEPNQIQLFTSVYSILFQIPYVYHLMSDTNFTFTILMDNTHLLINYILCGISFHLQSLTEYALLNIISPVSHSVANTVKRALLIWLSVVIFGNPVTVMSWFGTFLVIVGVIFYNQTITHHSSLATKDHHQPGTDDGGPLIGKQSVDSV